MWETETFPNVQSTQSKQIMLWVRNHKLGFLSDKVQLRSLQQARKPKCRKVQSLCHHPTGDIGNGTILTCCYCLRISNFLDKCSGEICPRVSLLVTEVPFQGDRPLVQVISAPVLATSHPWSYWWKSRCWKSYPWGQHVNLAIWVQAM